MKAATHAINPKVRKVLEVFTNIAILFKAGSQDRLWNKYPECSKDYLDAVRLFLEGYGFERQGRNPSYAHAAVEAIQKKRGSLPRQDFPRIVWQEFSKLLSHERLNEKANPLYHNASQCCCVWCKTRPDNMILRCRNALNKSQIIEARDWIKSIRGVGPKIASLFLRDLAIKYGLSPTQNRWLLQPIDVWVRRAVHFMSGDNMQDEEVARWLVNNCERPETVNQGIWYFAARIAKSEFTLRKCIEDPNYARKICGEHVESLKTAVREYEG